MHPLRWRPDHSNTGYEVENLAVVERKVDSVAILKDREHRNSECFQSDRPRLGRRMGPSLLPSPSTATARLSHRVDGVGMMAALILEGAIFQIISGRNRFMLTSSILWMKYVQ